MQFYLYRHIRLDTGVPFYIGIGKKNEKIIQGWKTEYRRAYTSSKRSFMWKNVVSKHGYKVEIVYEANTEFEIKEKEKEFIKLYGRLDKKNGTLVNYTNGADGRLEATKESLKRNIEILKNRTGVNHPGSKKTFQYDLNGNFIKEYACISNAMVEFKVSSTSGFIQCCKKKNHTYKNYFWFYEYQGEKIPPLPKDFYKQICKKSSTLKKKVAKIDLTNNQILEIFDSTMEVERKYGYHNTSISAVCKNKLKTAYGYKWKYL